MLNITEIVNNKINTMLEDETLKNTLETTIEELTVKTIKNSISTYEIRNIFEEKIKKEISDAVKQLNFGGYANFVISNLKKAVEAQGQKAITDEVIKYFNELYMPNKDKVLTVKELLSAYVEEMQSDDYTDETFAYMNVGEKRCPYGYGKYVTILFSLDDEYDIESDSKTYEVELVNVDNSNNEFKVYSILEDKSYKKDLTKRTKIGYLGKFERTLLSAYFNETKIIINDDDVDSYEDVVWSYD